MMKRLKIIIICLLMGFSSLASTNHYVSNAGNDANPGTMGSPWKTIAKVNSSFLTFAVGDSILFRRGDTFFGSIRATKSGSSSSPIVIGAYGTGAKPVITGLQTITGWTSLGGGVYEATGVTLKAPLNVVVVDGRMREMGRYPNSDAPNEGYLTFETHGSNSITDNELTNAPNWTGAELVIRSERYIIDRTKITSHSVTTLSYSPAISYAPKDKWGYFIQNDIKTLDQFGEWYYNSGTKKFDMFFGTESTGSHLVQGSLYDTVINLANDVDYIQMDNLNITGANSFGIRAYSSVNIVIKNCTVSNTGVSSIELNNCSGAQVLNNSMDHSNVFGYNTNGCTGSTIRANNVTAIALLKGMGQNGANKSCGIRSASVTELIEYNTVDSTGYIGIRFGSDNTNIKNNKVTNFCLNKDDGGGIYSKSDDATEADPGRKIDGNIIISTGSNSYMGTTNTSPAIHGIYLDDYSHNFVVTNNTIIGAPYSGIFIHNGFNNTVRLNTVYDAGIAILLSHNLTKADAPPLTNNIIRGNILFAKTASQLLLNLSTVNNDAAASLGLLDSNYYCRPLDDNFVYTVKFVNSAAVTIVQDLDLQGMRATYSKDAHSFKSSATIFPYKVNALLGSNKFTNQAFNSNITGMSFGTTGSNAAQSWISSKLDAGTYQVVSNSNKAGLSTTTAVMGDITTSKEYIIGYSFQSSKDTLLYTYARQGGSPYRVLSNDGVKKIIRTGTGRTEVEFAFIPTEDELASKAFIELPEQVGSWWVDNLRLYEADITFANPTDSFVVVYNATTSTATIPLSGASSFKDAKGNNYSTSASVESYGSRILIKRGVIGGVAPTVSVTSPTNGQVFTAPATVNIVATASDADGTIDSVAFYNGNLRLGVDLSSPYNYSWTSVPVGNYMINAKAYDNSGLVTTSTSNSISVNAASAPTVSITAPANNATYAAPATINITANASDAGTVDSVTFFNGGVRLGVDLSSPYTFTWSSVPVGNYVLTAVAKNNSGLSSTSPSVNIVVNANPVVTLTSPTNGASYIAPATVTITANASDADGITSVGFYNGSTLLHTEFTAPYAWDWTGVAAGTYNITAIAVDNSGAQTTSAVATITVTNSNVAPSVTLTSPASGTVYGSPATITISATSTDSDGSVVTVDFYNGSTLLHTEGTAPYTWDWVGVGTGTYTITAVATDNQGATTTSAASMVTVQNITQPAVRNYILTRKKISN